MDLSDICNGEVNWGKECDYDYLVNLMVNNVLKDDSEVFEYDFGGFDPRNCLLKSDSSFNLRVYSGKPLVRNLTKAYAKL